MSESESKSILDAIGDLAKRIDHLDECVHEIKDVLAKDREERTEDRAHHNMALQKIHGALDTLLSQQKKNSSDRKEG